MDEDFAEIVEKVCDLVREHYNLCGMTEKESGWNCRPSPSDGQLMPQVVVGRHVVVQGRESIRGKCTRYPPPADRFEIRFEVTRKSQRLPVKTY